GGRGAHLHQADGKRVRHGCVSVFRGRCRALPPPRPRQEVFPSGWQSRTGSSTAVSRHIFSSTPFRERRKMTASTASLADLLARAKTIRKHIITSTTTAGSGH